MEMSGNPLSGLPAFGDYLVREWPASELENARVDSWKYINVCRQTDTLEVLACHPQAILGFELLVPS